MRVNLVPLSQNLVNLLVIRHLGRPTGGPASAASVVVLGLLELLEQVPPLVCAHGGQAIEPSLAHLDGNLLPQVLVRLGGVEKAVHFAAESDQAPSLVLDPRLGALLRGLDFVVLAAAAVADHHLRRRRLLVGGDVAGIGDDLDHHFAAFFLLVEIDWPWLLRRQVHAYCSSSASASSALDWLLIEVFDWDFSEEFVEESESFHEQKQK